MRIGVFVLLTWFCLSVIFGLTGAFESVSAPVVALTVWTLTAIVLFSWWKIPAIHHYIDSIDLLWLIALHLARFVGIYFLLLCRNGSLSCNFARLAGIGDITVAAGAVLLLLAGTVRRSWRAGIAIWNAIGLVDIIFVVFNALRVGLTDRQGMAPLRSLPLMLLPTLLVPLIIASHVVIFARLAKRRDTERG